MTTSNIMALAKGAGTSAQVKGVGSREPDKKTKELAAEIYGSFMNHLSGSQTGGQSFEKTSGRNTAPAETKTADYSGSDFRSGRTTIARAAADTVREHVSSGTDRVEEAGEQILEDVSDQLGIPKDQVKELLGQLGLTAFDLLNPKDLGSFVMEQQGISDFQGLLTDQSFQALMTDLGQIGRELMDQLGLKGEQLPEAITGMDELISQMDVQTEPQEWTAPLQQTEPKQEPGQDTLQLQSGEDAEVSVMPTQGETQNQAADVQENSQPSTEGEEFPQPERLQSAENAERGEHITITADEVEKNDRQPEIVQAGNAEPAAEKAPESSVVTAEKPVAEEPQTDDNVPNIRTEKSSEILQPENSASKSTETEPLTETAEEPEEDSAELIRQLLQDRDQAGEKDAGQQMSGQQEKNSEGTEHSARSQTAVPTHHESAAVQAQPEQVNAMPQETAAPEAPRYAAFDTIRLISQISREITSAIRHQVTTLEMQLNPEHLGRLFVHMTSREGMVSAQLTAANEDVRAALEAQVATIRENLNQAGIKVDSIEVTVGTHEFEQNLEQQARGESEQAREQEQRQKNHRLIQVDSLDELSGLMSEEERLAAQIMLDHGNSMNVTA